MSYFRLKGTDISTAASLPYNPAPAKLTLCEAGQLLRFGQKRMRGWWGG